MKRCEQILDNSAQSFSSDLIAQLEQLDQARHAETIFCLKSNPSDPSTCMQAGEAQVYRRVRRQQLSSCAELPDNMLTCLEQGDRTSKECAVAYARQQGLVVSLPQAIGPQPRWDMALDGPVRFVLPMEDGTWLVRLDRAVLAIGPGRQLWKADLPAGENTWLADLEAGIVLAGTEDNQLVALDAVTGLQRWNVPVKQGLVRAVFSRTGQDGTRTELLLDSGQWLSLQPADCATQSSACLRASGLTIGEADLGEPAGQFQRERGRTLFTDKQLVHTDNTGKLVFRLRARDKLSGAVPHEQDQLLVSADGWLFTMDPLFCKSEKSIFIVPVKPQPKGLEELDLEHAAPPGCVRWRMPLNAPIGGMPISLQDKGIILRVQDRMLRFKSGKLRWKSGVGAIGKPVVSRDGRVFTLSLPLDRRDAPGIRCLSSATGLTLWRSELPPEWLADLQGKDAVGLEMAGPWLVAYAGNRITAIDLRIPPKPIEYRP